MKIINKIKTCYRKSEYCLHETKKSVLSRFLIILLILAIYFIFVSIRYGLNNGFMVTLLTWSFFVFCTPIADAGFLLDFPIRLITKIRMVFSEIFVWAIALIINIYALTFRKEIYQKTILLKIFKHILLNPFPFYSIIFLSALGTFLSIYFGDELIDVAKHKERKKYIKHKNKYKLIVVLFIIAVVIFFYEHLIKELGIKI